MSTYEERCAALGIERPESLVKGFKPDHPSVSIGEHESIPKTVGQRLCFSPPLADLSHLNPAKGNNNIAKWWGKLSAGERAAQMRKRGHLAARKQAANKP